MEWEFVLSGKQYLLFELFREVVKFSLSMLPVAMLSKKTKGEIFSPEMGNLQYMNFMDPHLIKDLKAKQSGTTVGCAKWTSGSLNQSTDSLEIG